MITITRKLRTAKQLWERGEVFSVVARGYNSLIWPRLPPIKEYGEYNTVKLSQEGLRKRPFDELVPWNTPSYVPDYKRPNVEQIRANYSPGDTCIVIGGGDGVTAVTAARQVGERGEVIVYEGDAERIDDLRRTLKLNDVLDICEINHAIVGSPHNVQDPGDAAVVHPSGLPECDAIDMDCEGAELEILEEMNIEPEVMVVELHHQYGFCAYDSEERIREVIREAGYDIERFTHRSVNVLYLAVKA